MLRPAGRLALFWNVFQIPPDLRDAVARVHRSVLGDAPYLHGESGGIDAHVPQFTKAADGIRGSRAFGGPEQRRFDWEQAYTKDERLDEVPGYGGYNRLAPEQLTRLLAGLGEVVETAGAPSSCSTRPPS